MHSDPDEFTKFEHDGWQRVAGMYEDAWSGLSGPFIPHLIKAVRVIEGDRMLDVACGLGYAAAAAKQRGAFAIGIDFSSEMVRLARKKTLGIEFQVGDAQALDFPDASFDKVVMNFGALHLARPEAAFREAWRALRPGGRYSFTVWAGPEQSPGAQLVEGTITPYADLNVELPEGPDYYGFDQPEALLAMMKTAGFDEATFEFNTVTEPWIVPSAAYIFRAERDAGVRTAALLAAQTPAVLTAIEEALEAAIQEYAHGDQFAIPFGAHVISVSREP